MALDITPIPTLKNEAAERFFQLIQDSPKIKISKKDREKFEKIGEEILKKAKL